MLLWLVKKSLSPGDLPRLTNTVGPGNKKTVTNHAKCSIRWHPAFIGVHWHPLITYTGPAVLEVWWLAFTRYYFTLSFVHKSIVLSFLWPACIAYTVAIRLHGYWAVCDPPSTSLLYTTHHTTLEITISCEGQFDEGRWRWGGKRECGWSESGLCVRQTPVCARVRACAGAAESLHIYIHTDIQQTTYFSTQSLSLTLHNTQNNISRTLAIQQRPKLTRARPPEVSWPEVCPWQEGWKHQHRDDSINYYVFYN